MEYVLPKFAVKVWPSKILLTKDREISLNVESHYTFGQRVEGQVIANLYLYKYSKRADHTTVGKINGNTVVKFQLKEELEVEETKDHTLVNVTVTVKDYITSKPFISIIELQQSVQNIFLLLFRCHS